MTDPNVRQPARVIVGHCPDCSQVLVVENNFEGWPWIECRCGWGGDTQEVANRVRFSQGEVE